MFAFYDNLTPAQKLLVTALLSMLFASLAAAGAAVGQLYVQGQVNIVVLFTTFMTVFFLGMSRELAAYVPAHVQAELQGLRDSENELQQALARQQAITSSAINKNVAVAAQSQNAPPPDVSMQNTARVPVPPVDIPAQNTMPELPIVPIAQPDYSMLHFGDTQEVPTP